MLYTVIVEMDKSKWNDKPGKEYHFPKRYVEMLKPGTRVVYYKGGKRGKGAEKVKDQNKKPLSPKPHYFAIGTIGSIYPDPKGEDGEQYAVIINFQPFTKALLAKKADSYFEDIPEHHKLNYWRSGGVRPITEEIFETIVEHAELGALVVPEEKVEEEEGDYNDSFESATIHLEGAKVSYFTTKYERKPQLKNQAVKLHGTTCCVCGFNFKEFYGGYAEGFIHIHHLLPVSELGGEKPVNPSTDLVPVCANCHSIIHRKKDRTLSIEELKKMIQQQRG